MKTKLLAVLIPILLILLSVPVSADDLTDVKKAGVLNFGTASGYRPFVFTKDDGSLDGLDIAMVKEIGRRLGVQVRNFDMAFQGLIDSVSVRQVDLIGGALSKTDEREKQVDFSEVYYTGNGIIIASSSGEMPDEVGINDMKTAKFGVQKGSSFDQWIKTSLVAEGALNTQNVFVFSNSDDAMKAIDNGTIDLVMLDHDVYNQKFAAGGKYRIVNKELASEHYAYAGVRGSTLIPAVNSIMDEMKNDGTMQKIIDQYLQLTFEDEAVVTINRPSQAEAPTQPESETPAATPIPPVNEPYNCKNVMVYMEDISIPDGTSLNPGMAFVKTWRLYNNGSCTWYDGYQLAYVEGDAMGSGSVPIQAITIPGTTVDVSMSMTAPEIDGSYGGFFQMRAPDGSFFGPKISARVNVVSGNVVVPAAGAPPVITKWQPDFYKADNSHCPTVYWNVRDAETIDFFINNQFYYRTYYSSGAIMMCPGGGKGDYIYGIVAEGLKKVSYVFTYTNTGGKKKQPVYRPTPLPMR